MNLLMTGVQYIGHPRTQEPVREQRKNKKRTNKRKKKSGVKGLTKESYKLLLFVAPIWPPSYNLVPLVLPPLSATRSWVQGSAVVPLRFESQGLGYKPSIGKVLYSSTFVKII